MQYSSFSFLLVAVMFVAELCAGVHMRTIEGPVLSPDEGFILGNGDLSVSCYQSVG